MSATAGQDLPLERLESWLRDHVEGFCGPVAAERFAGGQSNPTYRLSAASGQYVLRRKPPGALLPSAHAVDREFRVMRALAETPVPVPRVYALCEDDAVIGSAFYVMEHLDGRIFWDQRLPEIASPAERTAMFDSMNRVIGDLDWELSTIGDPLADFAYHVLTWRVTPELFRGLAGVDFAGLGIPDETEYVAAYCRRTGREQIAGWEFYLVYSLFRIAAILQGIAKRAIDGTAAGADAAEQGRLARPLAEQAWQLAQSLKT